MLTCDYSSVMKSRIISAYMCKTVTDLCIRSARVQHFSAFINVSKQKSITNY